MIAKFLNSWKILKVFVTVYWLFFACNSKPAPATRLDYSKIVLTEYDYIQNDSTNKREFYVASFIEIDSTGNCLIARREAYLQNMKYFKGVLPDSLITLFKIIPLPSTDTSMVAENLNLWYHGFSHCLAIRGTNNSAIRYATFIPAVLNDSLRHLISEIKIFQTSKAVQKIDSFYYGEVPKHIQQYLVDTIKYLFPNEQLKQPEINEVKFLPPEGN